MTSGFLAGPETRRMQSGLAQANAVRDPGPVHYKLPVGVEPGDTPLSRLAVRGSRHIVAAQHTMMATRRAGRSGGGARSSNHQRSTVCRVHETQNAKTKRRKQVRCLPGRAHPQQLAQDQAQMEGCGVNQQALGDVVLAAQVHSPQAACVQIHRVLGLVGQVRPPILQLG
jgi:hypothetical protein